MTQNLEFDLTLGRNSDCQKSRLSFWRFLVIFSLGKQHAHPVCFAGGDFSRAIFFIYQFQRGELVGTGDLAVSDLFMVETIIKMPQK